MSLWLPSMIYSDGIRKYKEAKFGGYNHNLGAGDGELWNMENLTSDFYPLLASRSPRYLTGTLKAPNGLYANDGLFTVDGTGFYEDGVLRGTVSDSRKRFASLGAYIIILPDMKYYNKQTGEFGSLAASYSGAAVIEDGTYAGEAAEANTVRAAGVGSVFRAGDAVRISGCAIHPENNKTAIIREIDGDCLRFYENTFVISDGGDDEAIVISRELPELDFACENENRLWGCKGDTIYASKLGDPFNFNVFDGISTDSYAADVGSAGDFTGCISYLGYPCFFKEEHIYKVYGDRPSNFQVMGSASLGVEAGSSEGLAIAGEILFYLSRVGVVAYSGGVPQNISAAFGTERYKNAVGGSDGVKYYVSLEDARGDRHLFVYDTEQNMWMREDSLDVIAFGWSRELYFLDSNGNLWLGGNAREIPAEATAESVEWSAEWGDFYEGGTSSPLPVKKHIAKVLLRMELGAGAAASVYMRFDGGTWEHVKTMTAADRRSYYLPIIPRRCDRFALKLTGFGEFKLFSLAREVSAGSEND